MASSHSGAQDSDRDRAATPDTPLLVAGMVLIAMGLIPSDIGCWLLAISYRRDVQVWVMLGQEPIELEGGEPRSRQSQTPTV